MPVPSPQTIQATSDSRALKIDDADWPTLRLAGTADSVQAVTLLALAERTKTAHGAWQELTPYLIFDTSALVGMLIDTVTLRLRVTSSVGNAVSNRIYTPDTAFSEPPVVADWYPANDFATESGLVRVSGAQNVGSATGWYDLAINKIAVNKTGNTQLIVLGEIYSLDSTLNPLSDGSVGLSGPTQTFPPELLITFFEKGSLFFGHNF